MAAELIALLGRRKIGSVRRDNRGRLSFAYDEGWRVARSAIPLSLSMPLGAAKHGHRPIEAFLWGLLPDNDAVLNRWGRNFQVSARNPFALISHVGEDCAGAVQFVRPERIDACIGEKPEPVLWLKKQDIAERMRALRRDISAWRAHRDIGQFSLAGAQPKTALLFEDGKWGVPSGRTPTTHILKPPMGEFDGHNENEHFCLTLARQLGLPTASSRVAYFGDEPAIVIERYDRVRTTDGWVRVHQEDACQALAVLPTLKYENGGGPGAKEIIELLQTHSSRKTEDVLTFIDALAFNWLIAGTDAHAKNYSLLLGAAGRLRLAPFYDIASALPYDELYAPKLKLAMRIGRKYRLREIGASDWQRLATSVRLDPEVVIQRINDFAARIPDEAASTSKKIRGEGMKHDIIIRLGNALANHAKKCRDQLKQYRKPK